MTMMMMMMLALLMLNIKDNSMKSILNDALRKGKENEREREREEKGRMTTYYSIIQRREQRVYKRS